MFRPRRGERKLKRKLHAGHTTRIPGVYSMQEALCVLLKIKETLLIYVFKCTINRLSFLKMDVAMSRVDMKWTMPI